MYGGGPGFDLAGLTMLVLRGLGLFAFSLLLLLLLLLASIEDWATHGDAARGVFEDLQTKLHSSLDIVFVR